MQIDRILVIFDAMTRSENVIQKGNELAEHFGASLCLYSPVHLPIYSRELFHVGGSVQEARDGLVEECRTHLEGLRPDGIDSTLRVEWAHPFEEGVERVLAETPCDLVVLALRNPQNPSSTEWRLIRACKTPLLVTKAQGSYPSQPYLLACVDPTHAHDKPAELDKVILDHGQALGTAFDTGLHVLHATGILPELGGSDPYPNQFRANLDAERAQLIHQLLPEEPQMEIELHFSHSTPAEAILAFIDARNADLCVIGSNSRSWLVEALIGTTLREVLPGAECDVLLIPTESDDVENQG
jgi:nucleotide-binding universal stress UspA family protein